MQLQATDVAQDDHTSFGKKRLQLIVSIHCLLCANKLAYAFCPGAAESLMVDTGHVIDDVWAKIRELAEEIETITLSSDDDDEPNMADVDEEEDQQQVDS